VPKFDVQKQLLRHKPVSTGAAVSRMPIVVHCTAGLEGLEIYARSISGRANKMPEIPETVSVTKMASNL